MKPWVTTPLPRSSALRRLALAATASLTLNALMLWFLAAWNRPVVYEAPPPTVTRLVYTTEPAPRIPPPEPGQPRPPEPPTVMKVDLDYTPEPPRVDPPLELDLDLSVPSVDTVFLSVRRPTQEPAPGPVRPTAPSPPAEPPADASPLDAEQVDQPPRELSDVLPQYPRRAAQARRTGHVRVRLLIDESGAVERAEVTEVVGDPLFREAVLKAVAQYRFIPARHRGRPVKVWATKLIRFELGG